MDAPNHPIRKAPIDATTGVSIQAVNATLFFMLEFYLLPLGRGKRTFGTTRLVL